AGFGIGYVAHHAVDELLQDVRTTHAEITASVGVAVEIRNCMCREFPRVCFSPFGRTQQTGLLAIPRCVDDRALGMPALLDERTHCADFLQQRNLTGDRIVRAVHPRVVVISTNHPFVRRRASAQLADHIVDRLHVPVGFHHEMDSRRPGSNLVGDWERTTPAVRRNVTANGREQWLRITVRDGKHGDLREHLHVLECETLCILRSADTRSQRITRIRRHVHHTATLDAVCGTHRSFGKDVTIVVNVIAGIGIDQTADRAVLRGDFRLDASPRLAVTRDDDRTLDRYTAPCELIVVRRNSIIDVDERTRDVAVDRVCVIRRKLFRRLGRRRVSLYRWFLEFRGEARRRDELDESLLWRREEHVERLDVRIPTSILELLEDPFRVLLVVRRANVMWTRGEQLHVRAHARWIGQRAEFVLPVALNARRRWSEAEDVAGWRRRRRDQRDGEHAKRGEKRETEESHVPLTAVVDDRHEPVAEYTVHGSPAWTDGRTGCRITCSGACPHLASLTSTVNDSTSRRRRQGTTWSAASRGRGDPRPARGAGERERRRTAGPSRRWKDDARPSRSDRRAVARQLQDRDAGAAPAGCARGNPSHVSAAR